MIVAYSVPNMSRRSRTQVIYSILRVTSEQERANGGARKTTIMYKANLNFFRLNRYFSQLEKEGLIEVATTPPPVYCLTGKGKELLKMIENAQKIIEL